MITRRTTKYFDESRHAVYGGLQIKGMEEVYRYWLVIKWDGAPLGDVVQSYELKGLMQFIGLNPSTATETVDDPTVRRCKDFARREGHGGMVMTNAFAHRSTDPKGMLRFDEPIGPENDIYLGMAAYACSKIVLCWGNHASHLERESSLLKGVGHPLVRDKVFCLGRNSGGSPKHPLYLKKTAPLIPFF
jgi:hypothetical protein